MDRVGGFRDWIALQQADARLYDDVVLAIAGEVDAAVIQQLELESARERAANGG